MLDFIKDLFDSRPGEGGGQTTTSQQQFQRAAAALMLEVAAADHVFDASELTTFSHVIARCFDLSEEEVETLYQHASRQQDEAVSLYQFTQKVNEHADAQEKFNLVKAMWQVALADDHLDKYEEHIIRKVADLIYLSHTDFLVARNLARQEQQAPQAQQ